MTAARKLSVEALQAINAPETAENFLWLVTIDDPGFAAPVRLCRGYFPIRSRNRYFVAFPFRPAVAQQDFDRPPTVSIEIGNVSRDVTAQIEQADGRATIDLEVVLATRPDRTQWILENLELAALVYDKIVLRCELTTENNIRKPYPDLRYTTALTPAVHRVDPT